MCSTNIDTLEEGGSKPFYGGGLRFGLHSRVYNTPKPFLLVTKLFVPFEVVVYRGHIFPVPGLEFMDISDPNSPIFILYIL